MRGYCGQGPTLSFLGLSGLVFFATSSKKKHHSSISFSLSAGLSQLAIASCVAACAIIAKVLSLINITPFQSEISTGGTFYNIHTQQMTRRGGFLSLAKKLFISGAAVILRSAVRTITCSIVYCGNIKRVKFFIFSTMRTVGSAVCFLQSSVCVPFAAVFNGKRSGYCLAFFG